MKKLVSLVLALCLVLASCAIAFAADNGTITVTNAEIGKKYVIYQLFDATVNPDGGTAYTLPSGKDVTNDDFFNTYFAVVNGNVTKKDALNETVLKSAAFKTWAKGFGTQKEEKVATSETVAFTGLDYGYYFIESFEPDPSSATGFKEASGAILTVDSANPTASVIDKNQTNKSEKKIVEGENKVVVNEAGINENVAFELTETVKNYDGDQKIYRYQIEDRLDPAFSYNKDAVVKVGSKTLTAGTDYTITYDDSVPSFVILIPWTDTNAYGGNHLYDNNSVITVNYSAKLDPTKVIGNLNVGVNPNKNIAQLKWFKGKDNPTTPNGERPEDRTDTYDTQLTIIKHDGDNNILTGAEFTLTSTNGTKVLIVTDNEYVAADDGTHYKLKDGTYTKEAPNNDPTHDAVYDSTTQKYKLTTTQIVKGVGQSDTSIASFVGDDGTVTFTGLAVGDYKIEETVVPAGYNKAADIEFSISFNAETKKFASSNSNVVLDETNNVFSVTVVNNQGTELPSTGGIGTTIFYILGGLLVVGAAVILVARRRVKE